MAVAEYQVLEAQLNETYPERFGEPHETRQFALMYMFGLLEACIARCALAGSFDIDSQAVDESIDELLAVLDTTTYEVVCCRHVSPNHSER